MVYMLVVYFKNYVVDFGIVLWIVVGYFVVYYVLDDVVFVDWFSVVVEGIDCGVVV